MLGSGQPEPRAEALSYSAVKLFSKYSNLCEKHNIPQRHRRTDGRTDGRTDDLLPPVLLSSRKVLVFEDTWGPIFKSLSSSSEVQVLENFRGLSRLILETNCTDNLPNIFAFRSIKGHSNLKILDSARIYRLGYSVQRRTLNFAADINIGTFICNLQNAKMIRTDINSVLSCCR